MFPEDQLRFLTGMGLTTLLSFLLRYLPSTSVRIYYSLILSLCIQFYTYGLPTFLPLLLHVFLYYVIKSVKRKHCGVYATAVSMLLVSIYYIYVMVVDFGRYKLDVSTILMMSICKYSLFAFSYQDGIPNDKEQNQQRIKEKLQKLPSLFEYFSFMVFLPTCLINTPFQYSMFISYIKQEEQFANIPLNKSIKKMAKQLLILGICILMYIVSLTYFPVSAFVEQNYVSKGLFHHIWYSYISIHFHQYKYFFGFLLMQIPVYAAGVSYDPTKGGDQFEGIQTIKIYQFETAYHLRDKIASWNMAVQQWLRKCVYERLPYGKEKNQLITFMVSALWHGFYPGVYVTFFLYFLQIYLGNIIYKFSCRFQEHWVIKFYKKTEKYSYYFCFLIWNWIFMNNSVYFVVLTASHSLNILQFMKFSNPIILLLLIIFFKLNQPGQKIHTKKI